MSSGALVGIIANPAAGKDIRRLASHALAVSNQQKVNIVVRILLALEAFGIQRVEIMPDHFGIGDRALHELRGHERLLAATSLVDMPVKGNEEDSVRAALHLKEAGAACILVLGGDGTCRAVARGCGDVPLLPISSGTNNVVPYFVEGTVVGLAAAHVAHQPAPARDQLCYRHKQLVIEVNGNDSDLALVDVALLLGRFTGARAVWSADGLRQIFVTRAQPASIGLSSVIGVVRPIDRRQPEGATARIGNGDRVVLAPIAPGRIARLAIDEITSLVPGGSYPVCPERPALLALDGERQIALHENDQAAVRLELAGPWIVDIERTLLHAVGDGMFDNSFEH